LGARKSDIVEVEVIVGRSFSYCIHSEPIHPRLKSYGRAPVSKSSGSTTLVFRSCRHRDLASGRRRQLFISITASRLDPPVPVTRSVDPVFRASITFACSITDSRSHQNNSRAFVSCRL